MTTSRLRRIAATAVVAAAVVAAPFKIAAQIPTQQELAHISASGSYLAARHAGQMRDAAAAAAYYGAAIKRDPKNTDLIERAFLSLLIGGDVDGAVKLADRVLKLDKNDRVARLVSGVHNLKQKHYAAARRNVAQSVRGPITDLTATLLSAWSLQGAGDTREAIAAIDRLQGPDWYAIFKELHAGLILDLAGDQKEAGKRLAQAYKLDSNALRVVEAYASWLSRNESTAAAQKVLGDFRKVVPHHPSIEASLAQLDPKQLGPKQLGPKVNETPATEAAPTAVAPPAAPPAGLQLPAGRLLAYGSRGVEVRALQRWLDIPDDGVFGARTKAAVMKFQRDANVAADGVVGPQTLAKLNASPVDVGIAGSNGAAKKAETVTRSGGKPVTAKLPRIVESAQLGAAEALYGLGASLGRRGGEDLGLVYLQLSLYLAPTHPLALLSLADLYETLKKPELAIKAYERVPASSPLHRNAAIQMAANLDSLDRADEAKKHLRQLIKENPQDSEAIMALGTVLRAHKEFAECAEVYSRAADLIAKPATKANWLVFYFRGICYERAKQWPKAEADLKKALELFPDQPHVLNYLGYSWIDQGVNLDEGMDMIKRAVAARSDDGYIVDSLGWAYYRLGNYEEAVKQLERAIELKPQDPTINDHLGDAYWRVGRKLEATFQWSHARDLKPEAEDLPKILEKLKSGLPEETSSQAKAVKKDKDNGG